MDKNYHNGLLAALGAYGLWGVLPIYWKMLHHVSAFEILASRFLWSAVFVCFLILLTGKWQIFVQETKEIFSKFSTGFRLIIAAITISFNWGIFIWAVEEGRIIETSMGYYINPLMSILFGLVFLKERLDKLQIIAVLCAAIGITYMVVQNGSLPWISVGLALTFSFYGLLKKIIKAQALTTTMLETLFISPVAASYLYYLSTKGGNVYQSADGVTLALLAGAGIVTATPLILFTAAAKALPLYMIGFMQYIAPSISLLIGVFMYGEQFTHAHAISFGCVWIGLAFFTLSQLKKI